MVAGDGGLYPGYDRQREIWTSLFRVSDDLVYLRSPEVVEVADRRTRAVERGRWTGSWTLPEGGTRIGGSYTAYWRLVDGAWKLRAELFVTLHCSGPDCTS